jgi:hypothetical protein
MWISKTQNRIEVSRPWARHQGISHGAVVIFSVELVVVTAAAILHPSALFAHNSADKPVWLHFEVDAVDRPGAAAASAHFHFFRGCLRI